MSRLVNAPTLLLLVASLCLGDETPPSKSGTVPADTKPSWIWLGDKAKEKQTVFFRKEFTIKGNITGARLFAGCDDAMEVFIDDKPIVEHRGWQDPVFKDVTEHFVKDNKLAGGRGRHVVAVRARNNASAAGLLMRLVFEARAGESSAVVTDQTWKATEKANQGWQEPTFNDSSWVAAIVVAKLGDKPWDRLSEARLMAAAKLREPPATPVEQLKVAKGFHVELLYSVPKDKEGSWVNLCVDPKGRLIVSDQYGGLYRVTPPPLGPGSKLPAKIDKIPADIGEAQGLLWAFDSLYVVVNRGQKYDSGLYRVRDTDGDDQLDEVKLLRRIDGGGEHGPHAVVLAPDGKSLVIQCGNGTKTMELTGSRVPRVWSEDHLLPRMPDGRGFMKNVYAPGGCIYQVDPEGKTWELLSMGYRNPYDVAFNRRGDLFTYDADMEWDMNTPWYRPTRVCHVTSGSEFGWRNGAGKWPPYYPDSLPGIVDIGPGSPTGICFGHGAKFPSKYEEALFICDWSYGKLYAVHLTPHHSTYKAVAEEFVTGTPLPLTDVVINPTDGAMYFAIGGRRTKSGLYRVTYVGQAAEPAAVNTRDVQRAHEIRRKLEAFHGRKVPLAVDHAWPQLGHEDRYIRFAARVVLEHQDPKPWQERALSEADPQASMTALLALTRVGDKALQSRLLQALDRIDWHRLQNGQRLELLRVYCLAFLRMGAPDATTRQRLIAHLDPHYPARSREVNAELCQMLVYLQAPSAASKTLDLLARGATQEEQMEYARSLRVLKSGWTLEQRKTYFAWFLKAAHFKGGASFTGFLRNIKGDAVATLTDEEKAELKATLEAQPEPASSVAAARTRPLVKQYTLDELAPLMEKGLSKRDFDRGRILFGEASCFACHRFDNEGGAQGPDLTGVAGRFSVRDLLESIVEPNKVISDQYAAVVITTTEGQLITGRIINLAGDGVSVNTNMLDPSAITQVNRRRVESIETSKLSMMPAGLLDALREDEILDLMAYLLSRGDRNHQMFH